MYRQFTAAAAAFVLGLVLTGARPATQPLDPAIVEEIRAELMKLPAYGVFDFLAFSYQNRVATLAGFASTAALKGDAERAVKRPGVDQVINRIDVLTVTQEDEDLRQRIQASIYGSGFQAMYASGGGVLWGHRHAAAPGLRTFNNWRFPGMEPAGDEPVHIIIKDGSVLLFGVVENEADKAGVGLRARDVRGSFPIENEVHVDNGRVTR